MSAKRADPRQDMTGFSQANPKTDNATDSGSKSSWASKARTRQSAAATSEADQIAPSSGEARLEVELTTTHSPAASSIVESPVKDTVATTVDSKEVHAIIQGYHGAPFAVLGPQLVEHNGATVLSIRAFRPLDKTVDVVEPGGERTPMQRVDPAGFFEALLPHQTSPIAYQLAVRDAQGQEYLLDDPYRFPPLLTDYDLYLFGEGNFLYIYEKLGAHPRTVDGVAGVNFAVWAPNAERVSVVGPFNGWDKRAHPLQRNSAIGVWELFIPGLPNGTHYKYSVKSRFFGYEVDKADPFGFYSEMRPSTDSRVWDMKQYHWNDADWVDHRPTRQALDQPLNIYEVHLGSWRRVPQRQRFLKLSRPGAPTGGICPGDGLYPHRTDAHHRASL